MERKYHALNACPDNSGNDVESGSENGSYANSVDNSFVVGTTSNSKGVSNACGPEVFLERNICGSDKLME